MNNTHQLNNEALLQVLSLSKDATAVYTSDDIIIEFATDAMIGFWGKDRSVIGKPLIEAVPELTDQEFIGILQNVWRTGITYEAIAALAELNVNGTIETFYFDFVYRAIKNIHGEIQCILHTATDVTDRERSRILVAESRERESKLYTELTAANAELSTSNRELTAARNEQQALNYKLTTSELRFRSTLEQAPVGMCILQGPEHVIELANDAILKIWGRKREEVIGLPHRHARPELKGQPVYRWLDEVYSTGKKRVNTEIKVRLYDNGNLRDAYVNSVYQALRDGSGNITGLLIILDEVTDQIKARKLAEESAELMRMAADITGMGTIDIDLRTNKMISTKQYADIFGFDTPEGLKREDYIARIHADDYTRIVQPAMESAYETGRFEYDTRLCIPGMPIKWAKVKGRLLFDEDGDPMRLLSTTVDVTEQKEDEARKNDFIAMVSHELKTPLTSIKAYIQLLNAKVQRTGDDFASGALAKVELQIERMHTLIKGFLDVARLEAGKIHLNTQQFYLNELLEEVTAEVRSSYMSGHVINLTPCSPLPVNADRDKIAQVINNLLSNAIKYSPKDKEVRLSCRMIDGMAIVTVTDQGMGIAANDIEKLFERFYRVESNDRRNISGFGIGLYLCAEIIQRHDGKIWVDSEVGKGSSFHFFAAFGLSKNGIAKVERF